MQQQGLDEVERQYAIALCKIPGVGPLLARYLVMHCGSSRNVFRFNKKQLCNVPGIGPKTAHSILQCDRLNFLKQAEQEIKYCLDNHIQILTYGDDLFPRKLRHCHDGPFLLYMKGNVSLNRSIISIVGSRNATSYGKKLVGDLVAYLAASNVIVVSGLALGIDGYAHKACLDHQVSTVAVLAHGLDTVYPGSHHNLARNIVQSNGALLTEYPKGTGPERMHFPARNRIVAGMADAVVVVESGKKGGALITADIANSYSRDVFAFPGRIDDNRSEGCNELIRKNKAALIRSGSDLFDFMGWELEHEATTNRFLEPELPDGLNTFEMEIYTFISRSTGSVCFDDILKVNPMESRQIHQNLLSLELKGAIRSLPGNCFAKA